MGIRYYMSGNHEHPKYAQKMIDHVIHRLLSVHYMKIAEDWLSRARYVDDAKTTRTVFLDSGAFTVWNNGGKVELEELFRKYDTILERFGDSFAEFWLINLDVIPGEKGKPTSADQMERALAESDENYVKLVDRYGKKVLPVFHQTETLERLKFVESQSAANYICLSPRQDMSENVRVEWCKWCQTHLDEKTFTHGLATTGNRIFQAQDWYSVDSASWIFTAAMGGIRWWNGSRMKILPVSAESPMRKSLGQHFDSLPTGAQEQILAKCEEYDVLWEDIQTIAAARCYYNLRSEQERAEQFEYVDRTAPQTLF